MDTFDELSNAIRALDSEAKKAEENARAEDEAKVQQICSDLSALKKMANPQKEEQTTHKNDTHKTVHFSSSVAFTEKSRPSPSVRKPSKRNDKENVSH